jgi:hypothetical protein
LRPAIEDYFDLPARCDEKPLFRQRMRVYQRIATPASSLTKNDVELATLGSSVPVDTNFDACIYEVESLLLG